MTAYIDYAYYSGTYGGSSIAEADFTPIAIMASIELDGMTLNRVKINGLSSYDEATQDLIKTATCMLADAINEAQDASGSASGAPGVASESVGGYSYSLGSETSYSAMMKVVRGRVNTLLLSTGLISSAICGDWRLGWL